MGDRRTPTPPCKQPHVGAEEREEVFLGGGWGGTSALAIRRLFKLPHTVQNYFYSRVSLRESLALEGRREGRAVGRKEKRKHPSRRAEAIRNAR